MSTLTRLKALEAEAAKKKPKKKTKAKRDEQGRFVKAEDTDLNPIIMIALIKPILLMIALIKPILFKTFWTANSCKEKACSKSTRSIQ